ncbi:acyl-CoA dehydrogenase family protein [Paraburkholderia fynbosensis]|uniref:Putative FMNH2-dependent monooxygenase SfnC n=1 Tax=Paraburkholderia fynbosensis TaxID=1200993 RepID=A0A6J5FCD2_9BURK|nr:acyl-CoA dehydrogenase family protein [Paraburkholderia fynbosensis]CAB3777289.1 putative FMNH2-dependent monooxygenase SfnC [Paraburkholderia fynbosensis]
MSAPQPDAASAATPAHDSAEAAVTLTTVEAEPGWRAAAHRCAAIAAQFADAVDRDARFPSEAFDALKRERLLSAMVPSACGGAGLSLADIGAICETLAQGCASTAMIYAMHQIQVACVEAHGGESAWHRRLLAQLVEHQWLLASATSEETIGGNMRTSACSVELDGPRLRIEKLAPTISYGAHADGILVTARRTAESAAADQVLIVALRDDTQLEKRGGWDALGMRGTCSEGFRLVATGLAEQILATPFAEIADQTMLPVSHTLWASVWTGIAIDAVNRAKAFFRAQARATPGSIPPAGVRLAEAVGLLQMMQARLSVALEAARAAHQARHDGPQADAPLAALLGFASDMNTLKTSISTTALQVVQQVLMICGMAGYKNGTPYSVGRHLRDLHSAPLMINNDRIAQNTASLLLAQRPAAPGKA